MISVVTLFLCFASFHLIRFTHIGLKVDSWEGCSLLAAASYCLLQHFEFSNPTSYLLYLPTSHTLCWQYEKQYWKLNLEQMTACVHPVSVQIQLRKKVLGTLAFFVSFISRSLAMLSCTLSSFTFPFLPLMLLQKHFVPPFTSLDSFNPGWATLE